MALTISAPCDWDQESYCCVDGCDRAASHQRLTGMLDALPVVEMQCCWHAAENTDPYVPGSHLWVACCIVCPWVDVPFANAVARQAYIDGHTRATGHTIWRLTDG